MPATDTLMALAGLTQGLSSGLDARREAIRQRQQDELQRRMAEAQLAAQAQAMQAQQFNLEQGQLQAQDQARMRAMQQQPMGSMAEQLYPRGAPQTTLQSSGGPLPSLEPTTQVPPPPAGRMAFLGGLPPGAEGMTMEQYSMMAPVLAAGEERKRMETEQGYQNRIRQMALEGITPEEAALTGISAGTPRMNLGELAPFSLEKQRGQREMEIERMRQEGDLQRTALTLGGKEQGSDLARQKAMADYQDQIAGQTATRIALAHNMNLEKLDAFDPMTGKLKLDYLISQMDPATYADFLTNLKQDMEYAFPAGAGDSIPEAGGQAEPPVSQDLTPPAPTTTAPAEIEAQFLREHPGIVNLPYWQDPSLKQIILTSWMRGENLGTILNVIQSIAGQGQPQRGQR